MTWELLEPSAWEREMMRQQEAYYRMLSSVFALPPELSGTIQNLNLPHADVQEQVYRRQLAMKQKAGRG